MDKPCGGNRDLMGLWVLFFLLIPTVSWGWTNTPTQGTFTVTYTEPTQDQNGNALSTLASCTVYVSINGGSFTVVQTVAASAPTGGGTQTITPTITWGPVPSQALPLNWEVKCTNAQGLGLTPPDQVTTLDPYPLNLFQ